MLYKRETIPICRPLYDRASRTRTGDLLGAISALAEAGFGFVESFPATRHRSPNTFPNISAPVLQ
jgi:hypothetical protein